MGSRLVSTFDGTKLNVCFNVPKNANAPVLILNDGLGCAGYAWKPLLKKLKQTYPIIQWNYRGHGKSKVPRDIGTMTIETLARDMICVLDALGVQQAVSVSHSMGVQVALEAYSNSSNRFLGNVFICGGYRHPIATWHMKQNRDHPDSITNLAMRLFFPKAMRSFIDFPDYAQKLWRRVVSSELSYLACLFFEVNYTRIKRKDFMPYFEGLTAMQANVFAHIAQSYASHNAERVLGQIRHPTLIIAGGQDTFCPRWVKEDMHEMVKNSQLFVIDDGSHATPIEHPQTIYQQLTRFLDSQVLPKQGKNSRPF